MKCEEMKMIKEARNNDKWNDVISEIWLREMKNEKWWNDNDNEMNMKERWEMKWDKKWNVGKCNEVWDDNNEIKIE